MPKHFLILLAFSLTACSTPTNAPQPNPMEPVPLTTPNNQERTTTHPSPPDQQQPTADNQTGSVEFRGFTNAALRDFRVIPESGTALFTPTNGIHGNIDGFWWRHSRQWFKIPNHCSVLVLAAPTPAHPSAFTPTHDCSALGTQIQKLRRLPHKPGFYLDQGSTGHGTDYPW